MSATFVVLSSEELAPVVHEALASAAVALGHNEPVEFAVVDQTPDLELYVHEIDPWALVAVDDASIDAVRRAFGEEAEPLAPDRPVTVRGYRLVAVPGFAACLDDLPAKRVAWKRLKAAEHPGIPY